MERNSFTDCYYYKFQQILYSWCVSSQIYEKSIALEAA